jgi:hypothetical protein
MKKAGFLLIVCVVLLVSCVKQRSCVCTTTHSEIFGYHFTETIFYTATKNAAIENCAANEDKSGSITTSCELK